MITPRGLILFFIVLTLLLIPAPVFSQESENESSYRLDESGRILQRIRWTRSNAYYYEVEIEQQIAAGEWRQIVKQKTEELFIEVSLAPGMYRYRILSYNVLDRVAATGEWAGIRVFATRDPKIERTVPEACYIELMETDFTFVLEGINLMENAEVYLISQKEGARRILPESIQYSEGENTITLTLKTAEFDLGPYNIVLTNPGKLQTVYEGFRVAFQRPVDINVSVGYAPLVPLYGYIFDSFSSHIYPAGFYARVNVVPLKRLWGFIGAEFTPQLALLETKADTYTVHGTMLNFAFDALYQYWFEKRTMSLNVRLGPGFTTITGVYYDHDDGSSSAPVDMILPMMNAVVSFELLLWRNLFAEAGVEYTQHFSARSPAPGILKVMAGAGCRF